MKKRALEEEHDQELLQLKQEFPNVKLGFFEKMFVG